MQYSTWAMDGQDVDRHLFGLKRWPNEDVPALHTDTAFAKSSHWELGTSHFSRLWFDDQGCGEGKSLLLLCASSCWRLGADDAFQQRYHCLMLEASPGRQSRRDC